MQSILSDSAELSKYVYATCQILAVEVKNFSDPENAKTPATAERSKDITNKFSIH